MEEGSIVWSAVEFEIRAFKYHASLQFLVCFSKLQNSWRTCLNKTFCAFLSKNCLLPGVSALLFRCVNVDQTYNSRSQSATDISHILPSAQSHGCNQTDDIGSIMAVEGCPRPSSASDPCQLPLVPLNYVGMPVSCEAVHPVPSSSYFLRSATSRPGMCNFTVNGVMGEGFSLTSFSEVHFCHFIFCQVVYRPRLGEM